MERFELLLSRIERRARLLGGIEGARLPLAVGLAFTLIYRLLTLFGVARHAVGELKWHWIILANLALVLGGLLWGYFRRVDPAWVLFRADRRLGLNEKLSALYELYRGRGRAEFIPLLSARLPARIEPGRAVPLRPGRGWLLPAALLLALLLGLPQQPFSTPGHRPTATGGQLLGSGQERLGELSQRLAALEELAAQGEEIALLGGKARSGTVWEAPGETPESPAPLPTGLPDSAAAELAALEEEFWGPAADPALKREVRQWLARAALEEGLEGGAAHHELQLEEIQAELSRLGEQLEEGALKELLERLPQVDRAEALSELAAAEALAAGLAEVGRRLAGEPSPQEGEGEEEALGAAPRGRGEGEWPPEESHPEGEEAGRVLGKVPWSASGLLDPPAEPREFHISGELGDLGVMEQLLSKGTPFEPGGPESPAVLRLDFQRVAAILEARAIPGEMREIVQRYFLIITEE